MNIYPDTYYRNMNSLSQANELYQYTALDTKSDFRLLTLLKGSGTELECELTPCLLQGGYHKYEALSYTWGSNEFVGLIKLNGKLLWITDNLYAALQNLRQRDEDRVLWIDAICINQGDKSEQENQVRRMGQIFEQADKVLFWLGKATPQIIALMKALNHCRDIDNAGQISHEVLKDWSREYLATGLQQMLSREWFTRVWILQEVAKARRADVCCGTQSVQAELFVQAPVLLKQELPIHCKPILSIMSEYSRTTSWWAQSRDMRSLMHRFRASKATDERDKIYALLGMSSNSADAESLNIDYQESTSQIIHGAMTYLLESAHDNQSGPIDIFEILDLISHFDTLYVTCFVAMPEFTAETTPSDLLSKYGPEFRYLYLPEARFIAPAIITNPSQLLFEDRPENDSDMENTCNFQTTRLMWNVEIEGDWKFDEECEKCMRISSWGKAENHVNVVVVNYKGKAILKAALRGCIQLVKHLLRTKLGLVEEERSEVWALYKCVWLEHHKALETLLKAGIDVNCQDKNSGNALQMAAGDGMIEMVEILLQAGADIQAQGGDYGNALQAAAYNGSNEVVQILLQAGADVNAQGGEYGNALQAAADRGSNKVVQTLLQAGANVNAQGGYYGNALQAASASGSSDRIVQILLQAGADVNAQGGRYGNALQAAAYNSPEVVQTLLQAGADVNAQGGRYGNALQAAMATFNKSDEVVQALLKAGADVNAQGGEYGNALQAAAYNSPGVVQTLLQAGADVNVQGGDYGSAIRAAICEKSAEVVKTLLRAGATVTVEDYTYACKTCRDNDTGNEVKRLLREALGINSQMEEDPGSTQEATSIEEED